MALALGIDIGGTTCGLALVDSDGGIVRAAELPTRAREGGAALMQRLLEAAAALLAQAPAPVAGIGVGSAGQIDFAAGAVAYATANLPGWTGMPVRARFAATCGLPVWVDNDANVAALAEQRFGAGQGVGDLVCLTLGTGVGAGVISGGRLLRGARGGGGELGHVPVHVGGRPCPCGQQGCLEAYVGAAAISARAAAALRAEPQSALAGTDLSPRAVFAAAAAGDPPAQRLVAETARYLAAGLAAAVAAYDPALVLLGGGVAQAGDPLLAPVRDLLAANPFARDRARVDLCRLGPDAGVIGAAAQVFAYA